MAITNPSKRPTLSTLTEHQCDCLLNRIADNVSTHAMLRDYTMTLLMLDAGMRVGELVQLRLSDLFFQGLPVKAITIRSEIAKRGVSRTIPLTRRLQGAILAWHNDKYFIPETDDAFAFRGNPSSNEHLTPRAVEKMLDRYALCSLGLHVHPHLLRHTFATAMLRVADIRVVQELLGHSSITTTQGYTHPSADDLRTAVDKLHPALL